MCTKLIAVDRLGSGLMVGVSFQMFALSAEGNVLRGEGYCLGGGNVRGEYARGGMSRGCPTLRKRNWKSDLIYR